MTGSCAYRSVFTLLCAITRFLLMRAALHVPHSSDFRISQETCLPWLASFCHRCALPGFRVGNPCVKQYISQDPFPKRSASSTASSHASFVRGPWVMWNRCWIGLSILQKIFAVCCSSPERPPWYGSAKMAFPFTGGNCYKSPAKILFRPPEGLRSRPSRANGWRVHALRK